ncbi:Sec-independent protein translocase protein TatB [Vibrio mangrovi]|uniref:Sec-independent protein translocase protein TatB n=1 Tax=Vibrio mangrovi TaxID=474394 RepID=A0A1Y6IW62_9VIBR|nr:Sec-independent protein translocase protein TatB [Vibrio mangrovi]MDW6002552.1 Sec-independent protein translocase protein TatB [Vibrio mangrovi]SMS01915.1 Sec-independent protein translocase protein TatB [Vibrio mangrovi]
MFDIGFWELVLISVIALVVLGPERLPHAIRSVARFIASAKQMANNVKNELSQELQIQELRESYQKAEQLKVKDLAPELHESIESLKEVAREVQQPYAASAEEEQPLAQSLEAPSAPEHDVLADKVSSTESVLPEKLPVEKHPE